MLITGLTEKTSILSEFLNIGNLEWKLVTESLKFRGKKKKSGTQFWFINIQCWRKNRCYCRLSTAGKSARRVKRKVEENVRQDTSCCYESREKQSQPYDTLYITPAQAQKRTHFPIVSSAIHPSGQICPILSRKKSRLLLFCKWHLSLSYDNLFTHLTYLLVQYLFSYPNSR